MGKIIDGKKLAQKNLHKLKNKISRLPGKPGLAAILVGQDPASHVYVRLKEKAAHKAGIYFEKNLLPANVSQKKILELLDRLNPSIKIHAILVQLPLPKKFNTHKIIDHVDTYKDVDGFKPNSSVSPPTIAGIIKLIESTRVNLKNKKACILANSTIFAKPLKKLLADLDLRVRVILVGKANQRANLKKTMQWGKTLRQSDVVVIAVGIPKFLTSDIVKKNAIIIDVGINKVNHKLVGDVDFDQVIKKVKFISPVPGGVGPMTVACLMENVVKLYEHANE